jgi:hypothetical protein
MHWSSETPILTGFLLDLSEGKSHRGADLIRRANWMEAGMDGQPVVDRSAIRSADCVDEGVSCRAAARRFGVAAATVIR